MKIISTGSRKGFDLTKYADSLEGKLREPRLGLDPESGGWGEEQSELGCSWGKILGEGTDGDPVSALGGGWGGGLVPADGGG